MEDVKHASHGQGQAYDAIQALELDEFEPQMNMFQGAPLLARVDRGDSFDNMLQNWFTNQKHANQSMGQAQMPQPEPASAGNQFANAQGQLFYNVQNFQPHQPDVRNTLQHHNGFQQPLAAPMQASIQTSALATPDLQSFPQHHSTSLNPEALVQSLPAPSPLVDLESLTHKSMPFSAPPYPYSASMQAPSLIASQSCESHGPMTHAPGSQPQLHQVHLPQHASASFDQEQRLQQSISQLASQITPGDLPPEALPSGERTSQGRSQSSYDTHSSGHASAAGSHLPLNQVAVAHPSPASAQEGNQESSLYNSEQSNILPALPSLQGYNLSVEAAKQAWDVGPKRKRGPMSAESKEKERARNRRAQKRFREREKERQEERQNAMANLEAQLAQLKREKDELARRNIELEETAVKKTNGAIDSRLSAPFDAPLYIDAEHEEMRTEFPSHIQNSPFLQGIDLKQMTYQDYSKVYKRYVEALHADLVNMKPGKQEHIIHLIHELCDLNLYLAIHAGDFARFICGRLDAQQVQASPAPMSVWRRCLAGLMLSQPQKAAMLQTRREQLQRLRPLLHQRTELHKLVTACGSESIGFLERRAGNAKVLDAVDKLKKNIHQEQSLLIQTLCAAHQQFLAPEQTAVNIVLAYPYYPDIPTLIDLIASETPGEQTAMEILGLHSLPPR